MNNMLYEAIKELKYICDTRDAFLGDDRADAGLREHLMREVG